MKEIAQFNKTGGLESRNPETTEEEIGVVDVWTTIVRRKRILGMSFLLSTLLGVVYLFVADPVYRATAYLLPPQQSDIQSLSVAYRSVAPDAQEYTQERVYRAFLESLRSPGLRRQFFDSHNLANHFVSRDPDAISDINVIFDRKFNNRILVKVDEQNQPFVTISIETDNPELAAKWLNQLVDLANEHTVRQLVTGINASIASEIRELDHQLTNKLKFAERRRKDTIEDLYEALEIARALGLKNVGTTAAVGDQSGIVINSAELPEYMRGSQALEKEISVLESRESDEPFIDGFRDLQERRSILEAVSIDPVNVSAVTVDSAARVPSWAEKPRKVLVMVLAASLGIIVGVLLILISDLSASARQRPN